MSHYAKLVEPLILKLPGRQTLRLVSGTEIKNVEIIDGSFAFDARIDGEWCPLLTDEDLPAFTDRGRAARAKRRDVTMARGRPATKHRNSTTTGFRLRKDQLAELDAGCKAADVTRNEAIIGALVLAGLVPR